ncbi:MAG: response regulator [Bacteriovoracaceae bacterium]|nr:response regulator [Bacteriovoracaceae bacterium]
MELDYSDYHILLVDDSGPMLALLSEYLRSGGFKVTAISDGEEALALVGKDLFDLVITDIFMPLVSGFDLSKKINGRVPVILISGVEPGDLDQSIAELSDAFLDKTIEKEMLIKAVKKAIDRWKLKNK